MRVPLGVEADRGHRKARGTDRGRDVAAVLAHAELPRQVAEQVHSDGSLDRRPISKGLERSALRLIGQRGLKQASSRSHPAKAPVRARSGSGKRDAALLAALPQQGGQARQAAAGRVGRASDRRLLKYPSSSVQGAAALPRALRPRPPASSPVGALRALADRRASDEKRYAGVVDLHRARSARPLARARCGEGGGGTDVDARPRGVLRQGQRLARIVAAVVEEAQRGPSTRKPPPARVREAPLVEVPVGDVAAEDRG